MARVWGLGYAAGLMLARDLLRQDPERVAAALRHRGGDESQLERWRQVDERRRRVQVAVEEKKRERNEASKAIGLLKRQGKDAAAQIGAVGRLKEEIETSDRELDALDEEQRELEMGFPNLPHPSVPVRVRQLALWWRKVHGRQPLSSRSSNTFLKASFRVWTLGPRSTGRWSFSQVSASSGVPNVGETRRWPWTEIVAL